ncbi:cysteine-rich receptor-like protein kinase 3 [Lotus japonicus]|uniref:cysteine-rich receptor-like protein kinase 3 n=1 Tax=Lotus japonicus TaxID=34305 RepID=UPI00258E0C83|nr:cysteine-rich receptor-like protein kinase 3 [Lotus japonicus]
MSFPFPWFLLLIFLCHHHHPLPTLADPRATEAASLCTNRTSPMPQSQRQVFLSNFYDALESLTSLVTTQRHGTVVKGSSTTQNATVYAFGECMKDLSKSDCDVCFAQCKTRVLRCSPIQRGVEGGRFFFDGCYLRYDAYNFFNQSLSSQDLTLCGNIDFSGNRSVHKANVVELVRNLSVEAPKNDGFFVGVLSKRNVSVYGLAQCWNFVNESVCQNCLVEAVTRIDSCALKEEGRVLNAGCYLRFSTDKFYDNSSNIAPPGTKGSTKVGIIVAESFAAVATLLIVATIIFFVRKNVLRQRRERRQFGAFLFSENNSKLNMPYEVLEKATNYFHDSNKLGEGGSGSVYKGALPDGTTVAIKRLSFNTTQWADHFFNEVNLIKDLQHKNLVKLLGCSITGPESLLVYEYVPNLSLHDHLSVRRNLQQLTWEVRHKIILGTAEGLAYLHEESQLKIIHRDIKLSNILLDDNFTPKIADFGLARLFPEDQSHISTAICGTLGYMAPEYIVLGKLTEKADIYSFGVLVIELLSGKSRTSFVQNSCSILHMVWSLYGSNRLCDIVDPILEGNYPAEEACKLLKIGLLCTQASAELRPPMSVVVKMINNIHKIADPTQPPFLNFGSGEFSRSSLPEESLQPGSNTQSSGDSMTESSEHRLVTL